MSNKNTKTLSRKEREPFLDVAVEKLLLARATNPHGDNRLPRSRGVMNDILATLQQQGVTNASRDMVYNHMKKLERLQQQKKQQQQNQNDPAATGAASRRQQQQQPSQVIQGQTNDKSPQEQSQQTTEKAAPTDPLIHENDDNNDNERNEQGESTEQQTIQNDNQNEDALRTQRAPIIAATAKAAVLFMMACQKSGTETEENQKDKNVMLKEVIQQVETEFGLPPNSNLIDRETVCESAGEPVPPQPIVEQEEEQEQQEEEKEESQPQQEETQQAGAVATGANASSKNDDSSNSNNNNNNTNGPLATIPMQMQNNNNGQPMVNPMQMQMAMAAAFNNNNNKPFMMGPAGKAPMMMFGPTPQGFPGFCRPFQTGPQPMMMPGMMQPFQQGFPNMQQFNAAAAPRFMNMMNNNNNQGMNMMNNHQMQCMMMTMMSAAANQNNRTQQTNTAASSEDQQKEEEDQEKKIELATNRAAVLLLVQQSNISSPYKQQKASSNDDESEGDENDSDNVTKKPSLNDICSVVQQVEQEFGLPANTIDKDGLVKRIQVHDSDDDDDESRSKRGKRNRMSGKHKRKLPGKGFSTDEDSQDDDDGHGDGGRARKRRATTVSRAVAKEAAKKKRQEKAAEKAARKEQEAADREAKAEAAAMEQAEKEAETAAAREYAQKVAAACDRATEMFLPIFRESRARNVQSPKGTLPNIVREVEEEFGLEEGTIRKDTIRGRVMTEYHRNKNANKTRTYNACMDSDGEKRNYGGRPKGSTAAARKFFKKKDSRDDAAVSRRRDKTFQAAMEKAATLYHEAIQKVKSRGQICSRGTLERIVQEVEEEFDLPESTLNVWSIRTRVKRGSLTAKKESNTSPLEDLEPEIVEECIRLAKGGQHLLPGVVMKLATAIVKRDPGREEAIIAWKKKNYKYTEGQALLGNGWYRGFLKRHGQEMQGNLADENSESTGII